MLGGGFERRHVQGGEEVNKPRKDGDLERKAEASFPRSYVGSVRAGRSRARDAHISASVWGQAGMTMSCL